MFTKSLQNLLDDYPTITLRSPNNIDRITRNIYGILQFKPKI